ncbi:MAG: UDP-galactopyranose mutase [Chitinophagaceae bacterium]|nr:UDP-galactopyranose mutase [Chitinophagaceae bacterium]
MSAYDIIIAGAGPVGCTLAERCATQLNWKVLLIDKRGHLAGNCHDRPHENGVLIHQYGPHYFRTNNKQLLDYLSQFTEWVPGNYFVTSYAKGEYFPFPINLLTLAQFFKKDSLTPDEALALLAEKREPIENPKNSEEFVLSRVGREMYETFYLGYTLKQWDMHPRDLATSVCGRIPVRLNTDCRYVDHEFQCTPKEGFTALFTKMTNHPNIEIRLNTDYKTISDEAPVKVYTGPVDEYFDYCYGKLPWRSLAFDFKAVDQEFVQPNVQINYSNDYDYTRTVEIKHVTRQEHPQTVISYEYPKAEGDPYYPIPTADSQQLYERYKQLAEQETEQHEVYFCGRLAEYKYFNTDEVLEHALSTFERIKNKHGH